MDVFKFYANGDSFRCVFDGKSFGFTISHHLNARLELRGSQTFPKQVHYLAIFVELWGVNINQQLKEFIVNEQKLAIQ